MVNPYDLRPVWGNNFVGRKQALRELEANPAHWLIVGARRVGKTSLLRQFQWLCEQKNIPAFYISFEGAPDRRKLTAIICRALRGQRAKLDFGGLGVDLSANAQTDCLELLSALDEKLGDQKVFLLCDEVEQLVSIGRNDPAFVNELRGILHALDNLKVVFAASPRIYEIAEVTQASPTSSFFYGFNQILLPILSEAEAVRLISRPQVNVPHALLEKILKSTHFHPYLIQCLCRVLFHKGKLKSINRERFWRAYREGNLDLVFQDAFKMLSIEEQAILRNLNRPKTVFTLRKLQSTLRSSKPLRLSLENLTAYGHIKKVGRAYQISNAFLAEWLKTGAEDVEALHQTVVRMDPRLCFVAMPFAEDFLDVFAAAIKPAVEACGYTCLRIDQKPTNKRITEEIAGGIQAASFMIADTSQKNPNCFYEFGFAHACGRPVIPITQDHETPPFDVKDYQHIQYDRKKLHLLRKKIEERILKTVGSAPQSSL
jgi:hypothetical protein